ncbi:MAG: hypothetical protein ABIG95_04010 [Candidatus Woesearchaeota archaeon]
MAFNIKKIKKRIKKRIFAIIGLFFDFIGSILLTLSFSVFNPMSDCNATVKFCGDNISLTVENQ